MEDDVSRLSSLPVSGDSATVWWTRVEGVPAGRVARGLLYRLLGEHLDTDPRQVELAFGAHGKPRLADEAAALRFNVSHSGEIAALAFCEGRDVGVDVERVRGDLSTDAIARRYLPVQTFREIERLGAEERPREFFRAWVRLEAYVKGHGGGLALLDASLEPEGWSIVDLELLDGYAAALAVEGDLPERVNTSEIRFDSVMRRTA